MHARARHIGRLFVSFIVLGLAAFIIVLGLATAAQAEARWKPTAANRPSTCATLWRAIGLPRDVNAARRDTTFVCHKRFALSHDNASKTPDWVIERLIRRQVSGKHERPQDVTFAEEKRVPPHGRARNADYQHTKNHLARGHMAPSADFSQSLVWMKDSFVLSNVVPQVGRHFNSGIWARLEHEVRKVAKARGEIYVITGPVRGDANTRSRIIAKADNACGHEIALSGPKEEAFICARTTPRRTSIARRVSPFRLAFTKSSTTRKPPTPTLSSCRTPSIRTKRARKRGPISISFASPSRRSRA